MHSSRSYLCSISSASIVTREIISVTVLHRQTAINETKFLKDLLKAQKFEQLNFETNSLKLESNITVSQNIRMSFAKGFGTSNIFQIRQGLNKILSLKYIFPHQPVDDCKSDSEDKSHSKIIKAGPNDDSLVSFFNLSAKVYNSLHDSKGKSKQKKFDYFFFDGGLKAGFDIRNLRKIINRPIPANRKSSDAIST
jgi:hypothetical protein